MYKKSIPFAERRDALFDEVKNFSRTAALFKQGNMIALIKQLKAEQNSRREMLFAAVSDAQLDPMERYQILNEIINEGKDGLDYLEKVFPLADHSVQMEMILCREEISLKELVAGWDKGMLPKFDSIKSSITRQFGILADLYKGEYKKELRKLDKAEAIEFCYKKGWLTTDDFNLNQFIKIHELEEDNYRFWVHRIYREKLRVNKVPFSKEELVELDKRSISGLLGSNIHNLSISKQGVSLMAIPKQLKSMGKGYLKKILQAIRLQK